jgi:hypothetical protein
MAVVGLKELKGRAAGTGFVSGRGALLLSSIAIVGELGAVVVCSFTTSAKGVRGGFEARNVGAVVRGFGAGRVYTKTCESEGAQTRHHGGKPTLREEAAVAIDQMLAQIPTVSKLIITLK